MMTTLADSTRRNESVQGFLDDVGKSDHMDENTFRTAQPTPNLKQSVAAGYFTSSTILIENSAKNRNEAKNSLTTLIGDDKDHSNKVGHHKKNVPLLQRLKVVNASREGRTFSLGMPLPKEVIVENHDDNDVAPGACTAFSELGVDGMLSISTVDKRTPMKFTFDGIVPSRSSLDEQDSDVRPGFDIPTREFYEDVTAPAILEGLEYELDDVSEPSVVGHEELLKGSGRDYAGRRRERCESTNTDLSIELSESQYLRNCEEAVCDQYKIFSPTASFGTEGNQIPIEHGFDVILQHEKEEKARKDESISPWIGFSFLGFW